MQSKTSEPLNKMQKTIVTLFLILIIASIFIFKNIIFKSTLILKSFGDISMDPEIALMNKKPTYLEFYAEWCEVCREMAPSIDRLRDDFNKEVNFVFLNVDNPKWKKWIDKFDVNGIPQINLFDGNSNLEATLTGLQDESILTNSIKNLIKREEVISDQTSPKFSEIQNNSLKQFSPRSHG